MKALQTDKRHTLVAILLIGFGSILMLNQFVDFGWYILPTLMVGFFAMGFSTREAGWFVPAGIFLGISLGSFLIELHPWTATALSDGAEGGVFMFSFALGWLSISLFSRLVEPQWSWWPLIPAGIFGIIGLAAFGWQPAELGLSTFSDFWPLLLVVAGLVMLFQRRKAHS